jgi:tRNA-uridine 2-sulfurtransferase
MKKDNSNTTITVALSGGVDSAVAAGLLVEQGYQVNGIFMKNWSGEDYGIEGDCPWETDQEDARRVCETFGIPFRSVNFEKEYHDKVIGYFFREYKAGRTPNPDVMCNKEIKFEIFLNKAKEFGSDMIATGHYARIKYSDGYYRLLKGLDTQKDQSYFLHQLNQEQLKYSLFPVGELKKAEVRKTAKRFNLHVANKKDSQGICFVGKIDVGKFLRENIHSKTGKIIDIETKQEVGEHDGIYFYTVGQREGLNIGGLPKPYFIVEKDIENNILYVAAGSDNKLLFGKKVNFENIHFIASEPVNNDIQASIRYRHKPADGKLYTKDNTFEFDEPQRAITPGQSIVFYDGEQCLGGATIS